MKHRNLFAAALVLVCVPLVAQPSGLDDRFAEAHRPVVEVPFEPGARQISMTANKINEGYPIETPDGWELIPDNRESASAVVRTSRDVSPPLLVQFDFYIYDDDGWGPYTTADGISFFWGARPSDRFSNPPSGGTLGLPREADAFSLRFIPYEERRIVLADTNGETLAEAFDPRVYTGTDWQSVAVWITDRRVRVWLGEDLVLEHTGSGFAKEGFVGVSAATGGADGAHQVRNVDLTVGSRPDDSGRSGDSGTSGVALSRSAAEELFDELWDSYADRLRTETEPEFAQNQVAAAGTMMQYEYRVFGNSPPGRRSLYVSLHGGGGAPASVNDRQWRNQIELYQPDEGVYLAPRAPGNTWDLWHQAHIDPLVDRLISTMIVHMGVDPNRVYLMGYSAGGDGVYQVAPRMADRFAAASMMAGHPNESQPLGLRNLPFAIFMGGADSAYDRNTVARDWGNRLAELKRDDPGGYEHRVDIYPGVGHWMELRDAVALPWMAGFERRPYPHRIVWRQDNVTHDRFYWLRLDSNSVESDLVVTAERDGRVFVVDAPAGTRVHVLLSDDFVDLDREIEIKDTAGRRLFRGIVERSSEVIAREIEARGDPTFRFTAEVVVEL